MGDPFSTLTTVLLVVKECCGLVLQHTFRKPLKEGTDSNNNNLNNNHENVSDNKSREDDWRVICFPFYKFFNWNEDEFAEEKYVPEIDWTTASV
jgi:hypothetical protein